MLSSGVRHLAICMCATLQSDLMLASAVCVFDEDLMNLHCAALCISECIQSLGVPAVVAVLPAAAAKFSDMQC